MYELFITNKNYSSWSLRSWVLMRQLELPFRERLIPLPESSPWEAFRRSRQKHRMRKLNFGSP